MAISRGCPADFCKDHANSTGVLSPNFKAGKTACLFYWAFSPAFAGAGARLLSSSALETGVSSGRSAARIRTSRRQLVTALNASISSASPLGPLRVTRPVGRRTGHHRDGVAGHHDQTVDAVAPHLQGVLPSAATSMFGCAWSRHRPRVEDELAIEWKFVRLGETGSHRAAVTTHKPDTSRIADRASRFPSQQPTSANQEM